MFKPAPESPDKSSYASLVRVNAILLAVSATLLTAAIFLTVHIIQNERGVAELKGTLLAQHELQEELLASQDSDRSPFPHLDPGVSYVLNPAMKQSTWKTYKDQPYRINRIGLRGSEIGPKPPGVTRIALVADSVLFGWKLEEEEKVSSLLQEMTNQRLGPGKYEFVTIAIPGWNIADQDRFLRTHLGRINPDFIVWSIIRNDLMDSPGVVPPGVLMSWNAPGKQQQQPFQLVAPDLMDAPAPSLMSRWQSNLRRIRDFSAEHEIPTSILWWRSHQRLLLDYVMAAIDVELPVIYIPGQYRYDEKNWCVEFPDCHPTPWANHRLAIGLMDELMRRGAIESVEWKDDELDIVEAFRAEREVRSSAEEQRAFMNEQAAKAPDHFDIDGVSPVLFGIWNDTMALNGLMLLRHLGENLSLTMEVANLWTRPGPAQTMEISVRNGEGVIAEHSATLNEEPSRIVINLSDTADFGLYEVEWKFRFSECDHPSACFSAQLLDARLQSAPGQ